MAPTTAVRLTPLGAFLDHALRTDTTKNDPAGACLGAFLASGRAPGVGWQSYDQLAVTLTQLTGREVTRPTLQTFTEKLYEIPDTRTVDGRKMPRTVDGDTVEGYLRALNPAIIDIDAVRKDILSRDDAHDNTPETETAAVLADPDTMAAISAGEAELAQESLDQP